MKNIVAYAHHWYKHWETKTGKFGMEPVWLWVVGE